MKTLAMLWLALTATTTAVATIGRDGGGRDVSVALFSTRTVHRVTLTPLSPQTWVARCARCVHGPLSAPLHLSGSSPGPTEILAGGSLRLTNDDTGDTRAATGLWRLRISTPNRAVSAVLTLPSERYVASVLNAETTPDEPAESLHALAILVRTYALNGTHYTPTPGHLPAILCDSTECQAIRLGPVPAAIDEATRATAGETLWFGSRRAEAYFSQSCGGVTEAAAAVWPRLRGATYLPSHPDPFCARRNTAAWHAEISLNDLAGVARDEGWRLPATIASAHVRPAEHLRTCDRARLHRCG